MLGTAIRIRDRVTAAIALLAARLLFPIFIPFSVCNSIPFWSSNILMKGIFTQLAAATAANGTNRHTRGGAFRNSRFRLRAVITAPPVAIP